MAITKQATMGQCPSCNADLMPMTFTEDGEEFEARKCSASCGWWG